MTYCMIQKKEKEKRASVLEADRLTDTERRRIGFSDRIIRQLG